MTNDGIVFSFVNSTTNFYFYNIIDASNRLSFNLNTQQNIYTYYFTSNSCCDNKWCHVALVYDYTLTKYFMYFNGVMCTDSIQPNNNVFNTSTTFNYNTLGCSYNNPQITTLYFSVLIDDFKVYSNVALSVSDIATICGNNKYYTRTPIPVLLNTLFNANDLSTTNVNSKSTSFVTKIR